MPTQRDNRQADLEALGVEMVPVLHPETRGSAGPADFEPIFPEAPAGRGDLLQEFASGASPDSQKEPSTTRVS